MSPRIISELPTVLELVNAYWEPGWGLVNPKPHPFSAGQKKGKNHQVPIITQKF